MNKESLQWLVIVLIALGLAGLGVMAAQQHAQLGQISRSLAVVLSGEAQSVSMGQNTQESISESTPNSARVNSVVSPSKETSPAAVSPEQQDIERAIDVATIVSPAVFEKGLGTVIRIDDLTTNFVLTSGQTARFAVQGMSDTYTYMTMKDARQLYAAPVDVITLEVLNGKVINAWSFSTTFSSIRSAVQFTRGGFFLTAQSFDPSGRTAFIGSMFQQ